LLFGFCGLERETDLGVLTFLGVLRVEGDLISRRVADLVNIGNGTQGLIGFRVADVLPAREGWQCIATHSRSEKRPHSRHERFTESLRLKSSIENSSPRILARVHLTSLSDAQIEGLLIPTHLIPGQRFEFRGLLRSMLRVPGSPGSSIRGQRNIGDSLQRHENPTAHL
jgi:hypothetical protein